MDPETLAMQSIGRNTRYLLVFIDKSEINTGREHPNAYTYTDFNKSDMPRLYRVCISCLFRGRQDIRLVGETFAIVEPHGLRAR